MPTPTAPDLAVDLAGILHALTGEPADRAHRAALADWLQDRPQDAPAVVARLADELAGVELDPAPSDERFTNTEYVVLADDFARLSLWREHHGRVDWQQEAPGWVIGIARMGEKLVSAEFFWSWLNRRLVLFYAHNIGAVMWPGAVDRWLLRHCNPQHRGRRAHCDAMNFHQCLAFVEGR